jgi:hypothetical protein
MKSVGGLGTVAIVLALAAPASATTWTVDPNKAAGCDGTNTCKTIDEAAGPAGAGDTIRLLPGFYAQPAPFTEQLTVTGFGAGFALIIGTVTFDANGTLARVAVGATGNNPAVRVMAPTAGSRAVTIESSILTGAGSGAGIEAIASALGSIAITGRHLTIADSGAAPATNLANGTVGTSSATLENSIVLGANAGNLPALSGSDVDNSPGHRGALFADPAHDNFFLRFLSPAIDQGGGPAGGETSADVDGEARIGTWDRGADEYVNHQPAAPNLVVAPNPARPGQRVGFAAYEAPEPDASRGDLVTRYRFDFGDGTPVLEQASPAAAHVYTTAGQYAASVTAFDIPGAQSAASNSVRVAVAIGAAGPDAAPPTVSITSPRAGQRLKRGKRGPAFRGRVADATGVRRVELALRRFEGRRCRWYDGRRSFVLGSCATPRFFRAAINDLGWSYTFPRKIVPRTGRYELRARATDFLGNRTTAFSSRAKTLAGFRIVP